LAASGVHVGIVRVASAAGLEFMPRDRRRVVFSGRVQGVGFRFTCQSLARGFEVVGFVRNLHDGRVELVAEGESAEVDAFIASIRVEMDTYIKNVSTEPEPPEALPLVGFSVRH
jgi:acylphosphatase